MEAMECKSYLRYVYFLLQAPESAKGNRCIREKEWTDAVIAEGRGDLCYYYICSSFNAS